MFQLTPSPRCGHMNACQQLDRLTSRIRLMRTHRQVQDGVATAVAAEAPASRKECFGVFCNIYDLKAVSPVSLTWCSHSPSPCSLKCSIGLASSAAYGLL